MYVFILNMFKPYTERGVMLYGFFRDCFLLISVRFIPVDECNYASLIFFPVLYSIPSEKHTISCTAIGYFSGFKFLLLQTLLL